MYVAYCQRLLAFASKHPLFIYLYAILISYLQQRLPSEEVVHLTPDMSAHAALQLLLPLRTHHHRGVVSLIRVSLIGRSRFSTHA
jgi:hypothetical protein